MGRLILGLALALTPAVGAACAPEPLPEGAPGAPVRVRAGSLEVRGDAGGKPGDRCVTVISPADKGSATARRVQVSECGEGCTRLGVDLPVGRHVLVLDGRRIDVVVQPLWWLVLLLVGVGLLASLVATWVFPRTAEALRLERDLRRLDARLAGSDEDHQPLRGRIQARLEFVREALDPLPRFLRWVGFAINHPGPTMALYREHLREAEQLLWLTERKNALLHRARAQALPPTLRMRLYAELSGFDAELERLALPVDDVTAVVPASLERAAAVLDEDALSFPVDVAANAVLVAGDGDEPPGGDPPAIGALEERLRWELATERAALRRVVQRDAELSPLQRREVDLRLDVLRCLDRALSSPRLGRQLGVNGEISADPKLRERREKLDRALRRWRRMDLAVPRVDPHLELLEQLVWRPTNREVVADLAAAAESEPLAVGGPGVWQTYVSQGLGLELEDSLSHLGEHYYWRRRMRVRWWSRTLSGDATLHLVPVPLTREPPDVRLRAGGLPSQDSPSPERKAPEASVLLSGPTATAYATGAGELEIHAQVELPVEGEEAPLVAHARPQRILVEAGSTQRQQRFQVMEGGLRLVVSALGLTAVALGWGAEQMGRPGGLEVYAYAVLVPFGVDLASFTGTSLVKQIRDRIAEAIPERG